MNAGNLVIDTLLRYFATQIPTLVALVAAIVLVTVNRSGSRGRAVAAFVLALVATLLWPPVVALSAWLNATSQGNSYLGSIVNGGGDFVLNILTGIAWLMIVLALFGGKTAE
ncbi:hypothetical protein [Fodinicola acaciae]|uniref:hypothetical protein n=1 Tax=Fodinicola acaciae TaxID=2681555 RepID=UPI0013D3BEA8|nr:hypothetical protein [Fodinicola acaciae]